MNRIKAILAIVCFFAVPVEFGWRAGAAAPGSAAVDFDPFMRGTLLSGQVTETPWQSDDDFLAAREKYGCPVLMAAYKTVLKDPLPGEEANVHLAARFISGTVVEPGGIFSQNRSAGPYNASRGYKKGPTYMGTTYSETIGGGVCKIASTLFNVAVLSDLAIVERHSHSMPVPYVPYGQDATVYYGVKDFRFMNSTDSPILIWARGVDNILYIGFYGRATPPKIVWNHEVLDVYKAPVVYIENDALPPGGQVVDHEGMDGAVIESWIVRLYPDGTGDVRDMGKRYYNPLPWIIERNTCRPKRERSQPDRCFDNPIIYTKAPRSNISSFC